LLTQAEGGQISWAPPQLPHLPLTQVELPSVQVLPLQQGWPIAPHAAQ
jgi:hypothetical protein